jgi:hypothetical protein
VSSLEAIGIGKEFLNRSPEAQQLRERMEMGLREIKKLLYNKRNGL